MAQTNWKLIFNPADDSNRVKLVVDESLAPLRAFFFELTDSSYPEVIGAALTEVGSGFDNAGVNFAGDLYPGDEPMDEDMVEVYSQDQEVRIPRQDFLRVLLEVGRARVSIQQSRRKSEWTTEMHEALSALEEAIAKTEP